MHCWQLPNWPDFYYDRQVVSSLLNEVEETLLPFVRSVSELPDEEKGQYLMEVMIQEAKNTSSIEGEFISREDIYSSIINRRRRVGYGSLHVKDRRAVGVGRLIDLVASTYDVPLTEATLKYWHSLLLEGNTSLRSIGDYRLGPEPMRIVSGPPTNPTTHYEAPPAERLDGEMSRFVAYLDRRQADDPLTHGILLAGISHLYFESIHPFEDGNGRIGRALIDHLLSATLAMPVPFSVSQSLQQRQRAYYKALNSARNDLNATRWMTFYLECICQSVQTAQELVGFVLKKAELFDRIDGQINANQRKVLVKLFDKGPEGFAGGLSAKNYTRITRTSSATASRDLSRLVELAALIRYGAGRSTRYRLNI